MTSEEHEEISKTGRRNKRDNRITLSLSTPQPALQATTLAPLNPVQSGSSPSSGYHNLFVLQHAAVPYIAPFLTFLAFLALEGWLFDNTPALYPIRFFTVAAVIIVFSRRVMDWRLANPLGSILLGVAVFVIWIGPDLLIPGYRSHWLFQNSIFGQVRSSVPRDIKANALFITIRFAGASLLVPILEELFWRNWLPRWLIDGEDFQRVPVGHFTTSAFWIVAILFALEHGPYWEVGLIAGILYNWWMMRTKRLADCILAHGVTNACLSTYVLAADQWQYWL